MHQNKLGTDKKIKLFMKNNAFRVAHKVAIRRLKKIMKNSNLQTPKGDGKKIIFNLIYGMYGDIIYWECGLAKALQMRGHDVKALVCGKAFTMCTSEYNIQSVHDDKTCKHCVNFSKDFLDVTGIPYSTYKDYLSDKKIMEIKNYVNNLSFDKCQDLVYKDIRVGSFSTNAVIRYFEGILNPDKDIYEQVLRSELINSIIATDAAEIIIEEEKPDVLVTRHMGYSSWGSFAEYCMKKGIRVCYPSSTDGYRKNTMAFDFNIRSKAEENFQKYYNEIRKKKPLNKREDGELQLFLKNRFQGKGGDTSQYGFSTNNEIELKTRFDFKKYEKTYAIFPNVAWDSSLLDGHKGFKDVYEWVSYTIKLFKNKPSYQLIIKIHPAEFYVMKSKNTISDYIKRSLSPLSENIKVIPPDTDISPYSLISHIDVGIVYNGTIGLEIALHGIPVVVAGIAHYCGKGFTYDVSTLNEYKDILFSGLSPLDNKTVQLARVYAYYYFIKSFIPYDFVYKKSFFDLGWNVDSLDDFIKRDDRFLDYICNYILDGEIYQSWSNSND